MNHKINKKITQVIKKKSGVKKEELLAVTCYYQKKTPNLNLGASLILKTHEIKINIIFL